MNVRDFQMKPLHDTYQIEEPNETRHIKIELDPYRKLSKHCKLEHEINKFNFIFVSLEGVDHEFFLITEINKKITHQNHAYIQNPKQHNEHYQK